MRSRFATARLPGLADAPRSGRPPSFTATDRAEVIAVACAPPAESGVPLARWSGPDLARELAARRQLAVSASTVRRWLASDALKPWQHRSWISVRDPQFAAKQLLARYAVTITQGDIDGLLAVFTPDGGSYSAFGDTYPLEEFPALVAPAPKGLFLTGTAAIDLTGDTATSTQPLCFVDQATHEMRIGYYNDTYVRTCGGWRLRTRAMTFIRRNGAHDSGRPHAFRQS